MLVHIGLWVIGIVALIGGPLMLSMAGMTGDTAPTIHRGPVPNESDETLLLVGWLLVLIGAVCLKLA